MHSRIGHEPNRAVQLGLQATEIAIGIIGIHAHLRRQQLGIQGPTLATRIRP